MVGYEILDRSTSVDYNLYTIWSVYEQLEGKPEDASHLHITQGAAKISAGSGYGHFAACEFGGIYPPRLHRVREAPIGLRSYFCVMLVMAPGWGCYSAPDQQDVRDSSEPSLVVVDRARSLTDQYATGTNVGMRR